MVVNSNHLQKDRNNEKSIQKILQQSKYKDVKYLRKKLKKKYHCLLFFSHKIVFYEKKNCFSCISNSISVIQDNWVLRISFSNSKHEFIARECWRNLSRRQLLFADFNIGSISRERKKIESYGISFFHQVLFSRVFPNRILPTVSLLSTAIHVNPLALYICMLKIFDKLEERIEEDR